MQWRDEGRQSWTREKGRVQITSWVENTNMTEYTQEVVFLQSINSDKHLPLSPFTGQFFRWRHLALTSMSLIFLRVLPTKVLSLAKSLTIIHLLWKKTILKKNKRSQRWSRLQEDAAKICSSFISTKFKTFQYEGDPMDFFIEGMPTL